LKRYLIQGLRIVVCAAALWWVLHGLAWHDWATLTDGRKLQVAQVSAAGVEIIDPPHGRVPLDDAQIARDDAGEMRIEYGVLSVWRDSNKRLLSLSLLLFLPVTPICVVRLVWMLRAQDIHIGYWESTKLTYAGNFFNFIMIGTTGGDLFKAYYVAQHTRHKVEAVTAILLDRVVGLSGLVILAAVALTFKLGDPRIQQLFLWVLAMLGALALGTLVYFLPGLRQRLRIGERLRWLPGVDKLQRIDRAALRMREHPRIVVGVFGCTFALQAIAVGSFYVWGLAMGMRPDWPSYYAYIGVSLVVAAVPVTPMGLGTMEATLMLFLRGVFGTRTQVVFLALGVRFIQLLWALPGVLVPLTGAHRPSPERLAELEPATASPPPETTAR
jgi:glycosyltransferase 2 family protein